MRPTWTSSLFTNWLDDFKAAFLEYIGTTFFLLLAFVLHDLYIALSMGFSLLVSVWIFYRATGGVFNPNISLALFLIGVIGPFRFVCHCVAQLIGGITAAAIVLALTPGQLASNTFLQKGINSAQGTFIEMFITAALVLAVLMLAAEKHYTTPFAPVGIGLTLFACHLWAVYYTGAGMNVARAFGPAVVTGFPYGTQWVYWVGDGLGSLLAAALYIMLKQNRYWRLTPAQDTIDPKESPRIPLQDGTSSRGRQSDADVTGEKNARGDRTDLENIAGTEVSPGGQRTNDSAV